MTLQNAAFNVNEDDGSAQVCVELTGGELAIDVSVLLNTNDNTANGRPMAVY